MNFVNFSNLGKILIFIGIGIAILGGLMLLFSKVPFIGKKRIYKAAGKVCWGCSFKNICSAKKSNIPTIYTDDKGIILATMKEKMKKDSSKEIYAKRKIIVEPVFGQIKTGGFRRFSLRGFKKAGGEFSLVCAVSNFKKIANMIKDQTGCSKERVTAPGNINNIGLYGGKNTTV